MIRKPLSLRSTLARRVLTLVSGKGSAQLITLAATPLVARLFSPKTFGIAAVFIAIATVLAVLGTLRYERALVLPGDDHDARDLFELALASLIGVGLIVELLLLIMDLMGWQPSVLTHLGPWRWALPLGMALVGLISVLEGWAIRQTRFTAMAWSDVSQATTTAGTRLSLGWIWGSHAWGLLAGYLLGVLVKIGVQSRAVQLPPPNPGSRRLDRWRRQAAAYRDFPLYNAPAGFVRSLAQNLPILLFGAFFSPVVAGLYAMANRLFQLPLNLIATAVRSVYLQRAAEIAQRRGSQRGSLVRVSVALALVGLPPALVLGLLGEPICLLVLGPEWQRAGRFVEILAPLLFTLVASIPATAVIIVYRRQPLWLRWQILVALAQAVGFALAWWHSGTPEAALVIFTSVAVLSNCFVVGFAYTLTAQPPPAGFRLKSGHLPDADRPASSQA